MARRSYLDVVCTCLTALKHSEYVTVADAMERYGLVDDRSVRNALTKLVEHGHAVMQPGQGRAPHRYSLNRKSL